MTGPSDLLALLERASDELRCGELLHANTFSLGSVMNASVIGDPRLDAGCGRQHETAPSPSGPARLSASEFLAVMDHLVRTEATWHNGSSVAQTVYTCKYLLEPQRVSALISLSAFCTSIRVTTKIVSDLAFETRVCEEEDMLPYLFEFPTKTRGMQDVPTAISDLDLAIERLEALSGHSGDLSPEAQDEKVLASAVLCRLRFRKHLLQVLHKLSGRTKQQLEGTRKLLILVAADLNRIADSGDSNPNSVPGFDPNLNLDILGPTPPRPVSLMPLEDSLAYFSRLLRDIGSVCDIVKVSDWPSLKLFMNRWAEGRPTTISRMIMARLLDTAGLDAVPTWVPQGSMMRSVLGLPPAGEQRICSEVETFVEQSVAMAVYWAKCKCLNRARQRRRHRKSVEDWSHLTQHANVAEGTTAFWDWLSVSPWSWPEQHGNSQDGQGPLSIWVEFECSQELLQHLLMGFELGCYLPYEFCLVFWYCDYLYGVFIEDAGMLVNALPPPKARLASGKEKLRKAQKQASNAPQAPDMDFPAFAHFREARPVSKVSCALAERKLCQGTMRLAAALQKAGLIKARPAPYNTEEQYFEQRFFVFSHLRMPAYLSYDAYAAAMDLSKCSVLDLLRSAGENFREACILSDRLFSRSEGPLSPGSSPRQAAGVASPRQEKLTGLKEVAKRNLIATGLLISAEAAGGGGSLSAVMRTTWEFSHHKTFPVLSIRRTQTGA